MKSAKPKGLYGPLLHLTSAAAVMVSLLLLLAGMGIYPISFLVYAVALYTLTKSILLALRNAADWGRRKLEKYPRTRSLAVALIRDYQFNTVFFTYVTLVINLAYGVFKFIVCAGTGSLWFGVLGGYYLVLGVARYLILDTRKRAIAYPDPQKRKIALLDAYRTGGIVMLILTVILLAAVWQMAMLDHSPKIPGRLIYAVALYTFYRVIVSAIHVFRSGKLQDPALSAVRKIGYADALVSLFSLQATLLMQFGSEDSAIRRSFNLLTGNAVCLWILALGIYMTVSAGHKRRSQG